MSVNDFINNVSNKQAIKNNEIEVEIDQLCDQCKNMSDHAYLSQDGKTIRFICNNNHEYKSSGDFSWMLHG